MNFAFTEQQKILRDSARRFLDAECPSSHVRAMAKDERGYSLGLWEKMAQMGWMGAALPAEYGGTGSQFMDVAILLEEMGRACLPSPFFSTVILGGLSILEAGSEDQKRALLPRIVKGELILALALTEHSLAYSADGVKATAVRDGAAWRISASKRFVRDAHVADCIVCVARTSDNRDKREGLSLFLVSGDSAGIERRSLQTIARSKEFDVVMANVRASDADVLGPLGGGWAVMESVMQKAAVAKTFEMIGGAARALELTVGYAKERKQFGRPIGSFQAIQHHCANMAIELEIGRSLAYRAAQMLEDGAPCAREASAAKAWMSDAYPRITARAQQIHGGFGYCEVADVQLYFKRAKEAELMFGAADFHREVVAVQMGL